VQLLKKLLMFQCDRNEGKARDLSFDLIDILDKQLHVIVFLF